MSRYQMVVQREDEDTCLAVSHPARLSEVEAWQTASSYLERLYREGFVVMPFPCAPVWDAQRRDVKLTVFLSEDDAPEWNN